MKQCAYCKNEFEPKKPKAIYCSTKCRTYSNREKAKIDKLANPVEEQNPYRMYKDGLHPAVKQMKDFVQSGGLKEKTPPPGLTGIDLSIWKAENK